MNSKLVFSIEKISEDYERKEPRLGRRFRLLVKEMILKIKQNPEIFQEIGKNQRRAVLGCSFPYSIYYFTSKKTNTIKVVRIFHQHINQETSVELLKLDKLKLIRNIKIKENRLNQLDSNFKTKNKDYDI